jgi:hypothetical protein
MSVPESEFPAAMQKVREAHATALRLAPGRVGVFVSRHRPFCHRSAAVAVVPKVGPAVPTATQSVLVGHATPFSCVSAAPMGFEVVARCQPELFQRWAIASGVPPPLTSPTAVHFEAEVHATLLR